MSPAERPPVEVAQGGVPTIEEPPFHRYVRSATDIGRIAIGTGIVLLGVALAFLARAFDANLSVAMSESFLALPSWLTRLIVDGIAVASSITSIALFVVVLARRMWRFLLVLFIADLIAVLLATVLEVPAIEMTPAAQQALADLDRLLTGGGTSSPTAVASLAVAAALAAPWLGRTWSRWLWILLIGYAGIWALGTPYSPGDVVIAVGAGIAGAGIAGQLLGHPNLRPRGAQIVEDFGRAGLHLASLRAASVDARGSTPYFGTTTDGREVFIKVLAEDERTSDLLFRTYRAIRFKNLGDFEPFSSLRRAVEHEALVSLWASANGIRTPRVAALATIGSTGIGLAYERIAGRSLDAVEPDELDDDTLRAAWGLIAELRVHGIAHRDLRLANVFLDDAGVPMLIDFGFSEMAATPDQLRSDIAEFLGSTAVVVGVDRAVAACVAVMGADALVDAAPRLQPMALSTATRKALKDAGLTWALQQEVVRVTGVTRIDFERLERIRVSTILVFVLLGVALYLLAPQAAGFQEMWQTMGGLRWSQVWPALLASAVTYVAAAVTLMGAVPPSIPFGLTFLAQLAGSFVNRIFPARVGGMATNVLYLQKRGIDTAVAVAGVGAQQVMGLATHVAMMAVFVYIVGNADASDVLREDLRLIIEAVMAVLVVSGVLLLIPWIRRKAAAKVLPAARRSLEGLAAVMHRPLRLAQLTLGAATLNLAYIAALVLSVRAFGGEESVAAIAVAYLIGMTLAAAAPTPGGLVAVEASLTATLVAMGVDKEVALPAVLLFRLVTFWLPVLPGWLSLLYLQRHEAL